jgi:trigger factor
MFEHNHIPELVAEIRRGKALAQIVENATVTDRSGTTVDLANLRPDGTIGDPAEAEGAESGAKTPADEAEEPAQT